MIRKWTQEMENKSLWCCVDNLSENIEYFNSESAAENYAKKMKFKDFFIFQEGKN